MQQSVSAAAVTRNFQFEASQRGRSVTGRISAHTLFSAMRILRMTGLEDIRIREVDGNADGATDAVVNG